MSARQALLPFRDQGLGREPASSLDELARRNLRLANVVESNSRRRDVREVRARLLLIVLKYACPLGVRPYKSHYVPGALVDQGVEGLRRLWRLDFDDDPPNERSVRSHLGALEAMCAIQRAPGNFQPRRRNLAHPEWRPRNPDTIHVLESEHAARYWQTRGEELLERNPDARTNPHRWRMLFARWRADAAQGELYDDELLGETAENVSESAPGDVAEPAFHIVPVIAPPEAVRGLFTASESAAAPADSTPPDLFGTAPTPREVVESAESRAELFEIDSERAPELVKRTHDREASVAIVAALAHAPRGPLAFVHALREAGVALQGPLVRVLASDYDRLLGASAMLAFALVRRGERVRNRAGWLVRAWRWAEEAELRDALAAALSAVIEKRQPPTGDRLA